MVKKEEIQERRSFSVVPAGIVVTSLLAVVEGVEEGTTVTVGKVSVVVAKVVVAEEAVNVGREASYEASV